MLHIDVSTFPVLTTERLRLRQLRASDAERLFAMRSDPLVMRYVNRPLALTLEDASTLIERINTGIAENDSLHWAITLEEDEALVGIIGFWRVVKAHHYAELGYTLAREHWGHGHATEAIAAVLDFGFGKWGLHRVEAITRPQNVASIRALEKNGFQLEGHIKEAVLWNGEFLDSLHYGKLAP